MTGIIFAFVTLGVLLAASWFAIMKRSVLCTSRKWLGCLGDFSRLVKKHCGTKSLSHSGNPELKLKRGVFWRVRRAKRRNFPSPSIFKSLDRDSLVPFECIVIWVAVRQNKKVFVG